MNGLLAETVPEFCMQGSESLEMLLVYNNLSNCVTYLLSKGENRKIVEVVGCNLLFILR